MPLTYAEYQQVAQPVQPVQGQGVITGMSAPAIAPAQMQHVVTPARQVQPGVAAQQVVTPQRFGPVPGETPQRTASGKGSGQGGTQALSAIDIRELGRKWAVSQGFAQDRLLEFDQLMALVASTYISSERVQNQREIASGSFGKIYASIFDNGPVAVKMIASPGETHNLKAKMREVLLELNILVRVRHPNIVTFWGSSAYFPNYQSQNGQPVGEPHISMVFELCDGGSLHASVHNRANPLSTKTTLHYALQIAFGLAYLHRRRADDRRCIIHRDLNTRNILVTRDGVAKICDFGCARVLDETGKLYTTTISGTPAYMAPEQLQGADLTEAIDVWSFSVVLWEMMAKAMPWDGALAGDMEGLINAIVRRRMVLPIPQGTNFPPSYIRALQSGMSLRPEDRPDMNQMVALLQEAQQLHAQTNP